MSTNKHVVVDSLQKSKADITNFFSTQEFIRHRPISVKGYIYCLSNKSMPGLLKIGFTHRTIEQRLDELDSATGVPTPFELEFCVRVQNAQGLEKRLHSELHEFRLNQKEFFKLPNEEAINRILSFLTPANLASIPNSEAAQTSSQDRQDSSEVVPRRTSRGRRRNADNGAHLNELWKIGARQSRFSQTGDFYMPLNEFPGALCDLNGYVFFKTEAEYRNCPFLRIGVRLSVPRRISSIPGYVRMRSPPER